MKNFKNITSRKILLCLCFILSVMMSLEISAQCTANPSSLTIVNNPGGVVTWSTNTSPAGDIYIESATTLRVLADVSMCKNARIYVKRGARLEINGATIKGSGGFNWNGIEVWGNSGLAHPNLTAQAIINGGYPSTNPIQAANQHGVIVLTNNAILEDALNAITTKNSNQGGHTGGIIIAQNADFVNNKRAVEFLTFGFDNISSFNDSKFKFGINSNPSFGFTGFVTMWDVHGVEFTNNEFSVGSSVASDASRKGIFSIDADYKFEDNLFFDLPRSIVAHDGTPTTGQIEITRNNFFGASLGAEEKQVEWKGVTDGIYVDNYTNISGSPTNASTDKVGLYLESCKGYEVTENSFVGSKSENHNGIYVTESGSQGEIIFNNPQFNLAYGILAEDNNGGLQIKCNNFSSTAKNNIYSWDNMGNPQGSCVNPIGPAGNLFSHPCLGSSNPAAEDYHVGAAGNWTYYQGSGFDQKVTCKDATIIAFNCNYDSEESCNNFIPNDPCSVFPFCRVERINTSQTNVSNIQLALSQTPPNSSQYEELQLDLSAAITYKELLYNSLIREALSLGQLGNIMSILEQDATHSLQQRRAELYLALKNYTEVSSELASLSRVTLEDNLFYDYYTTLNTLFSSGRTYFDLTNLEETTIRNVASYDIGVSKKAQNILEFVFGDTFSHNLQFPQSSSKQDIETPINIPSQLWTLYPNPTQDVLYIELGNVALTTEIYIVNIYGQIVKRLVVREAQTKLSIDTSDLPNGTYWTVLSNNSETLQSQKISIVK
ncbi:MAG: T9SS type A sorting domain-containing protein [Chitinophagales bacterium]